MPTEDNKPTEPSPPQSDVTMYKPDKPLRDMTRAEVDALADRIFQRFVEKNPSSASHPENDAPNPPKNP
jgi:hypothetical protein